MGIEWHYKQDRVEYGPVSSDEIRDLAGWGGVLPSTPVRRISSDNASTWVLAGQVKGLFVGDVSAQLGGLICPNCGELLKQNQCPLCPPVSESQQADGGEGRPKQIDPSQIIVTTGDLRHDYEIIGPVYFQVSNKGIFSSALQVLQKHYIAELAELRKRGQVAGFKPDWGFLVGEWSVGQSEFDQAFFIAVQELKKRAAILGADAIIGMRQDIDLDTSGWQYFYLQMYGTAVKTK